MEDKIKKAIENKQVVSIKLKNEDTQFEFEPYIYGGDVFQVRFIWGRLVSRDLIGRILLEHIMEVNNTSQKFEIRNDAMYLYSIEEDHWARVEELNSQKRILITGIDPKFLNK